MMMPLAPPRPSSTRTLRNNPLVTFAAGAVLMMAISLLYSATQHSSVDLLMDDGRFNAPSYANIDNVHPSMDSSVLTTAAKDISDAVTKELQDLHQANLKILGESKAKILKEIDQAKQKALAEIDSARSTATSAAARALAKDNTRNTDEVAAKPNDLLETDTTEKGDLIETKNAETSEVPTPLGISQADSSIKDFEPQERVVIASKIHGEFHWGILEQTLCLLQYAYNNRVNYDIVIFSTVPIDDKEEDVNRVKKMVAPASFTVVVDNPGLHEQVKSLTLEEQKDVLLRCNTSTIDELTWDTKCQDEGLQWPVKMSYTWQAEFRSLQLWKREELKPYKWMMWIDADAYSTNVWKYDPVATAIRNDMVLFFANWPKGRASGKGFASRFHKAFDDTGIFEEGETLCSVSLQDGHLVPSGGVCRQGVTIPQVHGFFHITNLDFMRSPPAQKFFEAYIGETHFSRKFDDQLAVTAVGGVLAPNRSCDMTSYGVDLGLWHNGDIMGKPARRTAVVKFTKWWKANATELFPEALNCKVVYNG